MPKTEQIQMRVSREEKSSIEQGAKLAGMDVSAWVLSQIIPNHRRQFQKVVEQLNDNAKHSFILAELNDLLSQLSPEEFVAAVEKRPRIPQHPYLANYLAAMVELAAHQKGVDVPPWTKEIKALPQPHFGSKLLSLRLHLLLNSPPPFSRRNIFIDSSIGERV